MASSDIITEVEIQPDIQEVEIETIPVEIPCETVETTIEGEDGQPMIALQPLPEPGREEIILQTQEEIVGADPLSVYDQIPVPENDIYVESSPGPSRKAAKKARKSGGTRFRASDHAIFGEMATETKARKWEQKQVQIKTLEGEFSVTMWASGTDDGECLAATPTDLSNSPGSTSAFPLLPHRPMLLFGALLRFFFSFFFSFVLAVRDRTTTVGCPALSRSVSFSSPQCLRRRRPSCIHAHAYAYTYNTRIHTRHIHGRIRTSGAMP